MSAASKTADIKTTVATVVSMIPGFLLPFVIASSLSPSNSDYLVLALSIMTTFTSAAGSAIELNTVSEYGRNLTEKHRPSQDVLKSYLRRIRIFGFGAIIILGVSLTVIYSISAGNWSTDFIVLCLLMLLTPVVSIFSSVSSGILIASGRAAIPIATQFLRPILALILLMSWPQIPLFLIPVAFAIGEFLRWRLLEREQHKALEQHDEVEPETMQTHGMVWQSSSAAMSQGAPVIDRVFLASAPSGSVSMYELTDKVFFAAIQLLNYGFLVRRVGQWSRIPRLPRQDAIRLLKKDFALLLFIAIILVLFGLTSLYFLSLLNLPNLWKESIPWAITILVALPFAIINLCASRLIVIARKQQYLIWFSLGTLTVNLVLNVIFFALFGAYGIIVSTVITRITSAIFYSLILWKIILPALLVDGSISESS